MRNDVRELLNRMEYWHPGTKYTFFRSMEKIRFFLEKEENEVKIMECNVCREPTASKICKSCQMIQSLSTL